MAASATSLEYVQKMYIAYFGRPAAPTGQEYYGQLVDAGNIAALQDDFWNSAESQALFNQPTTEGKVNAIFNQLFGRDAETAGLTYWTVEINAGRVSLPSAALTILNSASAADAAVFDAKMDVADAFTGELDTTSEVLAYQSNTAGGRTTLAAIETQAQADTAVAGITAIVAVVVAGGSSETDTFALTNGTDIKTAHVFTAGQVYTPGGDDRINSLQDEDQLTGTDLLTDRLDATLGNANDNGATIITPKLTGIEIVNVAFTGSGAAVTALDLQDASGQTEVNITRISQAVNAAEVGNIMTAASKLSLANTNANNAGVAEFSYGAGVLAGLNTGNLAVSNVQIGFLNIGQNTSGIAARGVGITGFETLTLDSTGAAANTIGTLNMPMDTGTAGSLVITGSANLSLGNQVNVVNAANNALIEAAGVWVAGTGIAQAGGRIATVDASAFTGNLSIVLDNILDVGKADTSGVVQNVTVKGGTGADTFVLYDAVQAGDSIDGGTGSDTLLFYSGSSLASVATGIEGGLMLADGTVPVPAGGVLGQISLDYDFLPSATGMTLRNISSDITGDLAPFGVWNNVAKTLVNFQQLDMTAAQAAALTIQHSTTGNGQIQINNIEAAVKANTAADLIGVTIAEGTNVDPRFNFTIDTSVVNTVTAPTASVSTFESVTLTDADSESNSVELSNFAQHTGTITIAGTGSVGTYLNLDVDTAGADVVANAITGTSILNNAAAAGVQQGMYGLNTDGLAVDYAAGNRWDAGALATEVRLGAATINAATELSNVIVRVGTNAASVNGAQSITMGAGNDTVIFDLLNDARAGLTISDTVIGGTGTDSLAIDGNATRVSLGASEWTNVSGFENIFLIGNGAAAVSNLIGQNSYNLTLTDALINANRDASGLLNIVNDNDANNDNLARVATIAPAVAGLSTGENTTGTGAESAVTIDARTLSATSHFTYNGEEGGWLDTVIVNGLYDIGEAVVGGTADKFIFTDGNVNGGNIINGGAVDNIATTWVANTDVFEIRNAATATTGDLAGLSNLGIIAGSNEAATAQTLVLQLNDTVVDSMVDSYHTSTATQQEALTVRMNSAADVTPVASAILDFDGSQLTARSIVNITLDAGAATNAAGDSIKLGMGMVTVAAAAPAQFDTVGNFAGANADYLVLSAAQFGLTALAGTTVTANGGGVIFGALGTGAVTDRIYVLENTTSVAGAGAFDTQVYFDADGSGAGAAVLIGVLVDNAAAVIAGAANTGLTIVA